MDGAEQRTRSLTQAVLQYRGMLYGFIFALVRDAVVAEEIFQEVALIAIEKDRKADEVIREPAQWLKEVVRRTVKAGFRTRQGRQVNVDPDYLEQVAQGLDPEAGDTDERLAALGGCLDHVSEGHRDLLRRRYVLGQRYEQISKELEKSVGALRALVHRVQRQLADCVELKMGRSEASGGR